MNVRRYTRDSGGMGVLPMVDVTFTVNDFSSEYPELRAVVQQIIDGQEAEPDEDYTIEQFDLVRSRYASNWERARWVAENLACLMAAEHLVAWGEGYRSDDGYDYLTAAMDNANFLTEIDLNEEGFRKWWDADPDDWGATDGEIRFMLFPNRANAWEDRLMTELLGKPKPPPN